MKAIILLEEYRENFLNNYNEMLKKCMIMDSPFLSDKENVILKLVKFIFSEDYIQEQNKFIFNKFISKVIRLLRDEKKIIFFNGLFAYRPKEFETTCDYIDINSSEEDILKFCKNIELGFYGLYNYLKTIPADDEDDKIINTNNEENSISIYKKYYDKNDDFMSIGNYLGESETSLSIYTKNEKLWNKMLTENIEYLENKDKTNVNILEKDKNLETDVEENKEINILVKILDNCLQQEEELEQYQYALDNMLFKKGEHRDIFIKLRNHPLYSLEVEDIFKKVCNLSMKEKKKIKENLNKQLRNYMVRCSKSFYWLELKTSKKQKECFSKEDLEFFVNADFSESQYANAEINKVGVQHIFYFGNEQFFNELFNHIPKTQEEALLQIKAIEKFYELHASNKNHWQILHNELLYISITKSITYFLLVKDYCNNMNIKEKIEFLNRDSMNLLNNIDGMKYFGPKALKNFFINEALSKQDVTYEDVSTNIRHYSTIYLNMEKEYANYITTELSSKYLSIKENGSVFEISITTPFEIHDINNIMKIVESVYPEVINKNSNYIDIVMEKKFREIELLNNLENYDTESKPNTEIGKKVNHLKYKI